MSLPPTSTKGSGDSTPVTTFEIDAPNIPITHNGVIATIGTIPIAGGGTGQVTKVAAFDALSPMTTAGDVIIGGASGTGTRLAAGTSTYVLTSNGAGVAPSWQAARGSTPVEAVSAGSVNFATSSGSYVDVTNLTVTVTTTGGRINAILQPLDGAANASNINVLRAAATASGYLQLVRDSTIVSDLNMRAFDATTTSANTVVAPGVASWTEKPGAGTYTYKVQARTDNAATITINNCILLVYEIH